MVVDTVEHDQKDANPRGHAENPLVGEAVGLQLAVLEGPNRVLHGLIAAVQRREVEVRGRLGLVHVAVVGPEEICTPC